MGSFYTIATKYENSIYERGEENHYVIKIKNIDGNTYVDPSSVSIIIYDPCMNEKVSSVSMTKSDVGIYYYSYTIPADATYGEYQIKVTADTVIYKDKFFLLPWNTIYDVRRYSGITSKKSISDHDIATITWEAYLEALRDVYLYHEDESPRCNPDTGAYFDGTNTTFATKDGLLADANGDGVVTGYGETSCGTDVDGWWKDTNGDCHQLKITVLDSRCGKLTLTQWNGTPIPSSASLVKINYYTEWRTFNINIFKSAVAFLAAHKCIDRFTELGRATLADLHSNKTVILHNRNRMEKAYKKAMRKISKPVIGAGMKPGE
jgi:hypothetical protein